MNLYRLNRIKRKNKSRIPVQGSIRDKRSLTRVRAFLASNPMLITSLGHAAIVSAVEAAEAADHPHKREDGMDICGEAVSVDQPTVVGSTAIIPIGGVVVHKAGAFERGSGAVDLGDIRQEILAFDADSEIDHIILDIDSPGGTVQGTVETASVIRDAETQITAFSDGQISSAAFWMASQADLIFTTQSAEVGSVGIFSAILDESEAFKMQGLKMDVISAGKFKGMGIPGTSLTDDQRAMLQDDVDRVHKDFQDAILSRRDIDPDDMEGQVFSSQDSLSKGFTDGFVDSLDELIVS